MPGKGGAAAGVSWLAKNRVSFPSQVAALDFLRAQAGRFARSPHARSLALSILRSAPQHRTPQQRAQAILRWMRDRVVYVPDPVGSETFQSPEATLRMGGGDCDDHAPLLAGIAVASGIPARLRAAGMFGRLSHVYPVLRLGNRWVPADSTLPGATLGMAAPADTIVDSREV